MKRIPVLFLILALLAALSLPALASEPATLVMDEANLLTPGEKQELEQRLAEIGNTYQTRVMVATTLSTGGRSADGYVEYLYDEVGLGHGAENGVLLAVCMDLREFRILCDGSLAWSVDIDNVTETITPLLSDGDYARAFQRYADRCAYYLDGGLHGFPFNVKTSLVVALVAGILVGLITVFVMKGQLKTVRAQNQANAYVKSGSMNITARSDLFLYRNVRRVKKESNNSSGSSGSRKVGGGSF